MKYMITEIETHGVIARSVVTTKDDINFVGFPAVVGNPNYDQFLVEVDLTDEEVHELPVDEWFEV